jgi:DNA transformation protein and related proteins
VRNSKVRRRIAAGKLRLRIRDLRNLGPRSETMLADIGIYDADALRRRGGLAAFLALRRAGVTRSLNALWALIGALDPWPEGSDWRDVASGSQRLGLLLAVESSDQARSAVAAAAAAAKPRSGRSKRRPGGAPSPAKPGAGALPGEAGAPGLPFDAKAVDVKPGARPKTQTPRDKAGRRSSKA